MYKHGKNRKKATPQFATILRLFGISTLSFQKQLLYVKTTRLVKNEEKNRKTATPQFETISSLSGTPKISFKKKKTLYVKTNHFYFKKF